MGYKSARDEFNRGLLSIDKRARLAMREQMKTAGARGVAVFDAYAHSHTTMHPPMFSAVKEAKDAMTVTLAVSGKVPTYGYVRVTPAITTDTTGANRQLVTVSGWRGRSVTVPRGFIWNGVILQRKSAQDRKLVNAKHYLRTSGALPTPAEVLAKCAGAVTEAVESAVDDALKVQGVKYGH